MNRHLYFAQYIAIIISLALLPSCEDTNVSVMTDAAKDAVTAITLSDEDVEHLAQEAAKTSDSNHRVAPPGTSYDKRLRKLLTGYSHKDGRTFNYKVYLTPEVNAFAMADGTVRVYSGLMDLMNNEELLFVIGHEMGHVVKNHSRKKVVLTYASSALRKGLASQDNEVGQIARSVFGAFAEQLTNAQFSQHEERQADRYGLTFLKGEGYDKNAAISALNKLAVLASNHTFLSSHPDPQARAELLMQSEDREGEDEEHFWTTFFKYAQTVVSETFELLRSLVAGLLAYR